MSDTTPAAGATPVAAGPANLPTPIAGSQPAGDERASTGQWVLGYYVGYDISRYPIASIDWSGLTHIAFAPLKANPDGTLNLDFDDEDGKGVTHAKELSTAAHAHGVKALLMLGGENQGTTLAQAASDAHRERLIDGLLTVMHELGYDGVDIDWEDDIVTTDLVALAKGLRDRRPDMILTYPGPVINPNIDSPDAGLVALTPYLDKFSIMSYSGTFWLGDGWKSWFVSPLSGADAGDGIPVAIDDSLQRWATAGVPRSKLLLGIGGFAICYPSYITGPRQTTKTGSISGGDNDFPLGEVFAPGGALDQFPTARHWDTVAQQPYVSLPVGAADSHCGQSSRYIPYDDEESIIAKGRWSRANGYGGTIVWTLQQLRLPPGATGGRSRDALVQALRTGFLG